MVVDNMRNLYEGSKYCYENSGTLKNKLDIRDYKQLEKYNAFYRNHP